MSTFINKKRKEEKQFPYPHRWKSNIATKTFVVVHYFLLLLNVLCTYNAKAYLCCAVYPFIRGTNATWIAFWSSNGPIRNSFFPRWNDPTIFPPLWTNIDSVHFCRLTGWMKVGWNTIHRFSAFLCVFVHL